MYDLAEGLQLEITEMWRHVTFTSEGLRSLARNLPRAVRSEMRVCGLTVARDDDATLLHEFFLASTRASRTMIGFYMENAERHRLVLSPN